jgi:carbonic anhydrase
MTCPNATSPINVSNNYDSICDLKCDYKFNYPLSTLNITNKGGYVYMTTEHTNTSPVIYNSKKYDVKEIRLYRNSLHNYSGKKADAELFIVHNNIAGTGNLIICVPIIIGSSNIDTTSIFDDLMMKISNTANSVGKQTTLINNNFSLNKFIPNKPFFSYSGTLPYSPCNGIYDYIVFNKKNSISMSEKAYKLFSKMITEHGYTTTENKGGLFFNKIGALNNNNKNNNNEEIYIDCQPTGSSGEVLVKNEPMNNSIFDKHMIKEFLNSDLFKIIIGVFIVLVLIYGSSALISMLTKTNKSGGAGDIPTSPTSASIVSSSLTSSSLTGGKSYYKNILRR